MVSVLLSLVYYLYFFTTATLWAVILSLLCVLLAPFERNRRMIHMLTSAYAYHCVLINPFWRFRFENRELLNKHKTCVLVANHQSLCDVLVLSGLFRQYKWVAKAQAFRILGVGLMMLLNQYASVAQGDLKSVRRMIRQARAWLRAGTSVFIFPEGERSFDGELLEFKDGPFRLACDTDTPVLPMVLDGTREILPRGGWVLNFRGDIVVRLLDPVHPSEAGYSPELLRDLVAQRIRAALWEVRGRAQRDQWYSTTPLPERLVVPCVVPEDLT